MSVKLTEKQLALARDLMPPILIDSREQWPLFAKLLQNEVGRIYANDYTWYDGKVIKVRFERVATAAKVEGSENLKEGDYIMRGFQPVFNRFGVCEVKGGLLIERKAEDYVSTLSHWQYDDADPEVSDRFERELRRFANYNQVVILCERGANWYAKYIESRCSGFTPYMFDMRDIRLRTLGVTCNWHVRNCGGHEDAEKRAWGYFWSAWRDYCELVKMNGGNDGLYKYFDGLKEKKAGAE